MNKKIFASLAAGTIALTACGGTAQKSSDSKTLVIYAFESAYGKDHWEALKANFEKANPGVKVELKVSKEIETELENAIATKKYPDVVYLNKGREKKVVESIESANQLENLDSLFEEKVDGKALKDVILPIYLNSSSLTPYKDNKSKFYAPVFPGTLGLVYNKNLVGEGKDFSIPKTWDELFAQQTKAKEKGVSLFTYPAPGYLDGALPAAIFDKSADLHKAFTNYEKGLYEKQEMKDVLTTFAKIKDVMYPETVANATADKGYLKNQQAFIDGKALFMPNGTWVIQEMMNYKEGNEKFDGYGFTALPGITSAGKFVGSFEETVFVMKEAKNKELAKKFIASMYSAENVKVIREKGNKALMPVAGVPELEDLAKNGFEVLNTTFVATKEVAGVNFKETVYTKFNNVIDGSLSVEDWISGISKANDILNSNIK